MKTWRDDWAGTVQTPEDLVRFVDAVGCCTLAGLPAFPQFPSQGEAFGTIAPGVPDPWFWKDDLHAEKRLYYTRVFGGQPGYVSMALLPAFIATNGTVADELMVTGALSVEARELYALVELNGPISSKPLKKLLTPEAKKSADRLLHEFDRKFILTKTGITGRTMGTYSYIWDLVERWLPEMLTAADKLGRSQATAMIQNHLAGFGIEAGSPFYRKVLGWG